MTFIVMHVLIPMILVDTIRDHVFKLKKQLLSNKYILLSGLAGGLADIDILLSLLFFRDLSFHRMFTHSIWIPLVFFFVFLFSYFSEVKRRYWKIFLMFFIGTSLHLVLDVFIYGSACLLCPISHTQFDLNFVNMRQSEACLFFSGLDAILLFLWLIHEELEHKISDYL